MPASRFARTYAKAPAVPVLRDVQHALALEHGFQDWIALTAAVEHSRADAPTSLTADGYERLADDLVAAFDARDQAALDRVNSHYQRAFTFDDLWSEIWRRVYAFRQRSSRVPTHYLQPGEARMVIAQDAGFGSWSALLKAITTGAPRGPAHAIDRAGNRIVPLRQLDDREWDALIAAMKEERITALDAGGI